MDSDMQRAENERARREAEMQQRRLAEEQRGTRQPTQAVQPQLTTPATAQPRPQGPITREYLAKNDRYTSLMEEHRKLRREMGAAMRRANQACDNGDRENEVLWRSWAEAAGRRMGQVR